MNVGNKNAGGCCYKASGCGREHAYNYKANTMNCLTFLFVWFVLRFSAGVGRTGTFITLDSMLDQSEAEGIIDVYNFVTQMRQNRIKMVQVSVRQSSYDDVYVIIFCNILTKKC